MGSSQYEIVKKPDSYREQFQTEFQQTQAASGFSSIKACVKNPDKKQVCPTTTPLRREFEKAHDRRIRLLDPMMASPLFTDPVSRFYPARHR
jgi:hypothetical protein